VAPPNYYTLENSGASSVESDSEEDDDAAVNLSFDFNPRLYSGPTFTSQIRSIFGFIDGSSFPLNFKIRAVVLSLVFTEQF
jgi:hypothetical protein